MKFEKPPENRTTRRLQPRRWSMARLGPWNNIDPWSLSTMGSQRRGPLEKRWKSRPQNPTLA